MISIRAGTASDVEWVNDYYASRRRSRAAKAEDFLLLAEDKGKLIGVVRLCPEEGHLVLRGMGIERAYRRQGLGRRMLLQLIQYIGDRDCYCLPWAHLVGFYGLIEFVMIADRDLPDFLQARLEKNREQMKAPEIQRLMQADLGVYPEDGLKMVGTKRSKS